MTVPKVLPNGRPTWGNIAVVVFFVAAISSWFMMAGMYREKVNYLETQDLMIRNRIREIEMWQNDWPTRGELMIDRVQNTRIESLLRRINTLERSALEVKIVE